MIVMSLGGLKIKCDTGFDCSPSDEVIDVEKLLKFVVMVLGCGREGLPNQMLKCPGCKG